MGDNDDVTTKRHRHLSPAAGDSPLPFMPEELIYHILLCLPAKSLQQFKRVCKSWETLISDPQFANNHLRNLTLNPSITHERFFCSLNDQPCKIISFPVKTLCENPSEPIEHVVFNMEHKFLILGSCNGLLCLFDEEKGYVMLWNPCIGFESKKAPKLDRYHRRRVISYYGFGYDHVNEKYKVLVGMGELKTLVTKIYTFGGNCWTTIPNFPSSCRFDGTFVSGTLNWSATKRSVSSTSHHSVIVSFDLEKETYKELLLPDNDSVDVQNVRVVGVLSNCLCVSFYSVDSHWSLWVMKKYGVAESWTRLTIISYELLMNHTQLQFYLHSRMFILENNIVVLRTCTKFMSYKFVLYNLNNGMFDNCLQGIRNIGYAQYIYHESLVSPQL